MVFEKININDLIFPEYNPRKKLNQKDKEYIKIKKSIEEFGYIDPAIVNKDNVIIGGNQRCQVLKDLGYQEIDIIRVDIPKKKEKALNIALNKISGEWDFEKLTEVLKEINIENEMDFALTGFDENEFDKLLKDFDKELGNKEIKGEDFNENDTLKIIAEPINKPGNLFRLGKNYLLCGDSRELSHMQVLFNQIGIDVKNTLVFTDPPYGINIVGSDRQRGQTKVAKAKKYGKVIGDETTETAKINYQNCIQIGFDKFIIWGGNYFLDFLPKDNLSWIVWDKRGNMESNDFGDGEFAYSSLKHPIRIYKHIWSGMIQEGKREERIHPTQKPVRMIYNIIKSFMGKNLFNYVIDFFGGSGSTLIACENLDLPCALMEMSPVYCDIIIKRYIDMNDDNSDDVFLIGEKGKEIPWNEISKYKPESKKD